MSMRVKELAVEIGTTAEKNGYSKGEICAACLAIFVAISDRAGLSLARMIEEVMETYKFGHEKEKSCRIKE